MRRGKDGVCAVACTRAKVSQSVLVTKVCIPYGNRDRLSRLRRCVRPWLSETGACSRCRCSRSAPATRAGSARGVRSPRSREALTRGCSGLVPCWLSCHVALLLPAASCRRARLLSYAPLPRSPFPRAQETLLGGAGWGGCSAAPPPGHLASAPGSPPGTATRTPQRRLRTAGSPRCFRFWRGSAAPSRCPHSRRSCLTAPRPLSVLPPPRTAPAFAFTALE